MRSNAHEKKWILSGRFILISVSFLMVLQHSVLKYSQDLMLDCFLIVLVWGDFIDHFQCNVWAVRGSVYYTFSTCPDSLHVLQQSLTHDISQATCASLGSWAKRAALHHLTDDTGFLHQVHVLVLCICYILCDVATSCSPLFNKSLAVRAEEKREGWGNLTHYINPSRVEEFIKAFILLTLNHFVYFKCLLFSCHDWRLLWFSSLVSPTPPVVVQSNWGGARWG